MKTVSVLPSLFLSAVLSCLLFFSTANVLASDVTPDNDTGGTESEFSHAIDIMGFEKRLSDTNELYIIRNNTENTITLVKLRVYYKTPKGEMLDYREVILSGELLPNTTKQFETPSFDRAKRYYYLEGNPGSKRTNGYPFIITYDLMRYDIAITE